MVTISIKIYINKFRLARMEMPLTQFLYYDLPGNKIVVNACRNQNYRKYFEIRKKYGIKFPGAAPSEWYNIYLKLSNRILFSEINKI